MKKSLEKRSEPIREEISKLETHILENDRATTEGVLEVKLLRVYIGD